MEENKKSILRRRVKKVGFVSRIIAKSTIWYPLKITLLILWKAFSYLMNILATVMIIGVITGIVVCCAFILYIKSNIVAEWDGLENLKFDSSQNTTIYYTDAAGNEILMEDDTLHGSENSLWAEYSELPQDLVNAVIAIEDQRFISHSGVDIKRTIGAVLKFFMPGSGQYGGSTLTQQLIKNVSGDKAATIQRKVQEIFRAIYVEQHYSKEQILEMYLNIVFLSQNTNGVKAAAKVYFGKELKDLTLVECAAIASIPKSPTYYDPIRNPDNNLIRRNLILKEMLSQEYITEEEFEKSFNVPLYLETSTTQSEAETGKIHSYYVDAVIEDVIAALMETYSIDRTTASRMLYSAGLQIVINMDPDVQSSLEEVFTDESCFPETTGIKPQAAMVVIDPSNGNVLGIVGGRGAKLTNRGLNRATQSTRQCGSSIKPLSVYAQALDNGLITYGTPVNDYPEIYDKEKKVYWPDNTPSGYDGVVPMTWAVLRSKNTIPVELVQKLGEYNIFDFLTQKVGLSTLISSASYGGVIKSDIAISPLALGSFTEGVTVLDVAQGYTMFANGGYVSEARTFSLVRNASGEIIIDRRTPKQTQAISEQTAFIMTKLLETVITHRRGTAWTVFNGYTESPKFKYNVEIAGKTGSTNDDRDRYYVGYTPDYVAACWFGYDNNKSLSKLSYNPAIRLWIEVYNRIYAKLESKNISYNTVFEEPYGVVEVEYCTISGKLATDACRQDIETILADDHPSCIQKGWFTYENAPTEECDCHVMFKFDSKTKALCLADCTCPESDLIDVALRKVVPRVFQINLMVADSQYTCIDPEYFGETMEFSTSATKPYYYSIYEQGTYPGRSNYGNPYNRLCTEHYHPDNN